MDSRGVIPDLLSAIPGTIIIDRIQRRESQSFFDSFNGKVLKAFLAI